MRMMKKKKKRKKKEEAEEKRVPTWVVPTGMKSAMRRLCVWRLGMEERSV